MGLFLLRRPVVYKATWCCMYGNYVDVGKILNALNLCEFVVSAGGRRVFAVMQRLRLNNNRSRPRVFAKNVLRNNPLQSLFEHSKEGRICSTFITKRHISTSSKVEFDEKILSVSLFRCPTTHRAFARRVSSLPGTHRRLLLYRHNTTIDEDTQTRDV